MLAATFEKQSTDYCNTVRLIIDSYKQIIKFNTAGSLFCAFLLPFQKQDAYFTHNATKPPSDITEDNLSDSSSFLYRH